MSWISGVRRCCESCTLSCGLVLLLNNNECGNACLILRGRVAILFLPQSGDISLTARCPYVARPQIRQCQGTTLLHRTADAQRSCPFSSSYFCQFSKLQAIINIDRAMQVVIKSGAFRITYNHRSKSDLKLYITCGPMLRMLSFVNLSG
jgi:hypothetical protein